MPSATLIGRMRTVWTAITLMLVVAVILIPIALLAGVRIVSTPSVPPGLWLVHRGTVERGSYVMACLPRAIARVGRKMGYLDEGICSERVAPVMKHVAAVPGDTVVVMRDKTIINGRTISGSARLTRDYRNRPIPQPLATGVYRLRENEYWLLGDWHRSWDSRYFGAIPASAIIGIGIPLFVGISGAS